MPSCRAKLDSVLPSTSRGHLRNDTPSSPVSPTGRIAKRNAQLITEIDLKSVKKTSTFSENVMGTVPDFETCDISEKCTMIQKIFDSEDNVICPEYLNVLQKQLEDLVADNIDNQKRINGEISYLNTGEYPTDNLSDRLMPNYVLRTRNPVENKRSNVVVGNVVDLGLNSSPEEDEENPSVVDVPQRFWNWTREYLRHITEDYVVNFKEKIVDRFNEDSLQKFMSCDLKSERKVYNSEFANSNSDKKSCTYVNGDGIVNNNDNFSTPVKKFDRRFKRRLSKSIDDCSIPVKSRFIDFQLNDMRNTDTLLIHAIACTVSQKNGNNDNMFLRKVKASAKKSYSNNGFEAEANDNNDEKLLNNDYLRSNDVSPVSNGFHNYNPLSNFSSSTNGHKVESATNLDCSEAPMSILTNLRELGSALSSYGSEKGILSSEFAINDFVYGENTKCTPVLKTNVNDDADSDLDEVSREIKKKQKELRQLASVTFPAVNEIYERLKSEYALYETSRRLDLTDDKLFELGSKYDSVTAFTKDQRQECAQALLAREKALKQFYYHFFKTSKLLSSKTSLRFPTSPGKLASPLKKSSDEIRPEELNDSKCAELR